uniref:Transmembrane protein n=1 Tax=Catharus ustulatus TaxID=91951 RepID=A0A8C3VIC4_CATUS
MCNIIYISVLQAIYKDVNSKAYLLRLSSFLIYIYTIVHLIYFFFQYTFSLSLNKQQIPLVFQKQVMFHSKKKKKVMSDSSEIFCHC